MKFIRTDDAQPGIAAISKKLIADLESDLQVLWLVPGGSSIKAAVAIMETIPDDLSVLLTITLSDERFGPVGHADSNWQQLIEAGMDFKSARQLPPLTDSAQTLDEARQQYEDDLTTALSVSDMVVAQLGMGPDGHIAGILPGSPAVAATGLVAAYETGTFTRLTATFEALKQADVAYVLAFGDEKLPALENLSEDLTLDEQPAQIIKYVPEAFIYNDQIGDQA